jgi:hypothetical protein
LNLDPKNKDAENTSDQAKQAAVASAAELKKARDDFERVKDQVKDKLAIAGEGPIATVTALKKRPEDMTAGEISDAIAAVDKAIAEGKLLLPADAGLLQRALYVLKMALFELGGVDPKLAVKDKQQLEELIAAKSVDAAPATQHNVKNALDGVNQAQATIARRNPAGQNSKDSAYPGLAVLKQKKPEALSAQELTDAIDDIDRAIAQGKLLLPADASLLQRALYALKMALFELGGVDPKLRYEAKQQLLDILQKKMGADEQKANLNPTIRANLTKAQAAVSRAQAVVAKRYPSEQDSNPSG